MSSLLLFVLVTLGALVTSLTGLGGGTLVLAGLLLVFPPTIAIPLHSFNQLAANGLRTGIFFKQVNWKVVAAYALLMIPAAWVGAKIFHLVNPSWLKIIVGSFILISVLPISVHPKSEPRFRTFVFLGALSGFLGVFVGAVGPLVTPFFNRLKIERQGMLSTKSAGQALLQISKIIAFWGAAGIDFVQLQDHVLILILGSLVGVALSIPISKKISDQKFNLIINILLGAIAIKILYEGVTELI
ncbi:MAG: sulfite exporter TauE/SafE family protein [Bdellovibrionales bacterium]|nr:sulfite exporter TauE/SafE family protein [Bdellovibrionales bacterium]